MEDVQMKGIEYMNSLNFKRTGRQEIYFNIQDNLDALKNKAEVVLTNFGFEKKTLNDFMKPVDDIHDRLSKSLALEYTFG